MFFKATKLFINPLNNRLSEMKKNVILSSMAICVALLMSVMFVACGKDNEEGVVIYTAGCESLNGSLENLKDLATVENIFNAAFKKELGVSSSPFQLSGSVSSCDTKVKKACQSAVAQLDKVELKLTFKYTVTNVTSNQNVFTYSR